MNILHALLPISLIIPLIIKVGGNHSNFKEFKDQRSIGTTDIDAWDLILNVLDACVQFSDNPPDDSSENIFFYSEMDNGGEMWIDGEIPEGINQGAPLKILVHGWNSDNGRFDSFHKVYKQTPSPVNVLLVKWTEAKTINYCSAATETKRVGYTIARLLQYLIEKNSTHPYVEKETIHLVGHSLGAHAVGFAGKYFQEMEMGKIHRITGLDPAYPGFRNNDLRLSKDDAEIVDVIHSNGQVEDEFQNENNLFHLGFTEPLGHFDFYPNGGYNQPGCNSQFTLICNHGRSSEFFQESIQNSDKPFYSQKCESYEAFIGRTLEGCGEEVFNYPGDNLKIDAPEGKYYFCTKSSKPFDKGDEAGIKCKPTVCDMYKKRGSPGTFSNIDGLRVSLDSFKYSDEIMPNDKEFVGVDEITNNSPATVTQIVTHSKRTYEKTEMMSSKYWGKINQVCAKHAWGGSNVCHKFQNDCASTDPTILRTETESEFSLTREVIVPPFTNIHICSTVSVSKDTEVRFEATARYTGEGLWAEEIVRILAADGIEAIIDKSGPEEAAITQVTGSIKISLALEPQFVVSNLNEDGRSLCTSISRLMQQRKLMSRAKALGKPFSESEYNELMNQLDALISGSSIGII